MSTRSVSTCKFARLASELANSWTPRRHAQSVERGGHAALDAGPQAAAGQSARDHGAVAVPVHARVAGEPPMSKTRPARMYLPIGRDWPRLEAA